VLCLCLKHSYQIWRLGCYSSQFCDLTDGIQSNNGSTVTAEFVTSLLSSPEHTLSPSLLRRFLASCTRRRRSRPPPTRRPRPPSSAAGLSSRPSDATPAATASAGSCLPPPSRPPRPSSRTPSPASSGPRPPSRASPARPRPRGSSPPASGPAPSLRPSTPPSPPAVGSPPSRCPPSSVRLAHFSSNSRRCLSLSHFR
jgi:hypothetical protein